MRWPWKYSETGENTRLQQKHGVCQEISPNDKLLLQQHRDLQMDKETIFPPPGPCHSQQFHHSHIFLSFFLPFLVWPLLRTQCRCRGLLLHRTILKRTPSSGELFWVWSGATITLYLHNKQHSQKTNIHAPHWDMNLQSKQVSGCRPMPNTMQPKGLASFSHIIVQNYHTGHSDLCWSGT